MNILFIKQITHFTVHKIELVSFFLVYINYQLANVLEDVSFTDLLNIEQVGSTGLLIVAVVWFVREMNRKEKLFLSQIDSIKHDNKEVLAEKDKKIEELTKLLIERNSHL